MNLNKLADKFPEHEIEWRVQRCGISGNKPWAMVLAYVTARAVMNRLDAICGPHGWKDDYEHRANGVMCRLSIKVDDEWITKVDGAPETDIESFKGGISKALVRCAVKWGIGRYLYYLDCNFAECSIEKQKGWNTAQTKDRKTIYWKVPQLPKNMLPDTSKAGSSVKKYIIKVGEYKGKSFDQIEENDLIEYCKELSLEPGLSDLYEELLGEARKYWQNK